MLVIDRNDLVDTGEFPDRIIVRSGRSGKKTFPVSQLDQANNDRITPLAKLKLTLRTVASWGKLENLLFFSSSCLAGEKVSLTATSPFYRLRNNNNNV